MPIAPVKTPVAPTDVPSIVDNPGTRRVPLTGYSDRLSARPGETIGFKLSADARNTSDPVLVHSWLTHSICADPNPAGPGIIERDASFWYKAGEHQVSRQRIQAGSCALSSAISVPGELSTIQISATVWPTLLNGARQCIMSFGSLALFIDENHCVQASLGEQKVCLPSAIRERRWISITARVEIQDVDVLLSVSCDDISDALTTHPVRGTDTTSMNTRLPARSLDVFEQASCRVSLAASHCEDTDEFTCHFNGKLESPELSISSATLTDTTSDPLRIRWDFSKAMSSRSLAASTAHDVALELINLPTRAMKGSTWSGTEMCWRHAPEQYAAIHFHDDDLVDANWQTSFTYTLPVDIPSGVYIMHISDGEHTDAMPFFVCAARQQPTNRVCVLVSTFTYAIYGNHARPDWVPAWQEQVEQWNAYPYNPAQYPGYGLSTYNDHSDNSGICHASHLRPLFNLRPGYITFGNTSCSGLRHFQADSHLLTWLDAMNIGFDVITDRELHDEGVDALSGYDMLMTGSHPEYHTVETLDALQSYRDGGGHLSYLGGNGFYWRIAVHPEQPDALEIRRAEAGIRAWAAEPGEYYQAFDGQYGGLWRRNGRPPQALCGLGFSAQGQFNGSYYRRINFEPAYQWLFEGIDDERIGDFGLCGGGAAGFELDRADTRLGTSTESVVLASSESHSDDFILVPEEMLTHLTTLPGPSADELIRADILWSDIPDGGSVFAVGSITFCGSLPHNNFDNPVSRLLKNVVEHVLENKN
ncbi:MAG: N,N-dimethylformamidase beta subunit family domain-containing protein [Granulosicoccus sp.]